jgi:replicative superfamily II helicase
MFGKKTMLLINCPMIGLSATMNNGEEICQWIERVADLNKYVYTNRQLLSIHAIGLMNAEQLITNCETLQ